MKHPPSSRKLKPLPPTREFLQCPFFLTSGRCPAVRSQKPLIWGWLCDTFPWFLCWLRTMGLDWEPTSPPPRSSPLPSCGFLPISIIQSTRQPAAKMAGHMQWWLLTPVSSPSMSFPTALAVSLPQLILTRMRDILISQPGHWTDSQEPLALTVMRAVSAMSLSSHFHMCKIIGAEPDRSEGSSKEHSIHPSPSCLLFMLRTQLPVHVSITFKFQCFSLNLLFTEHLLETRPHARTWRYLNE